MTRQDLYKTATEIYESVPITALACMSFKEIFQTLVNYRRDEIHKGKAKPDEKYNIRYDDGFVFINKKPAFRVAAKSPRIWYNDEAYYWEGRILAKQEENENE